MINVSVNVGDRFDVETPLKLLKKKMLKDGLFKEMKKRAYYEKPSVRKRRKQNEARRKLRKAAKRRAAMEERE